MAKRILIFSTAYFPLVGGAEVAIKEITDRLPEFEFDLITARLDRKFLLVEKIGRVTVYRFGWGCRFDKIWLALLGGFFASRLHKKNSYDLVWAMMASFGGFAASAFKKKNPKIPYLLTLQEGDDLQEIENKVRFLWKSFLNIFTRANYIQAISNYLADWAKRLGATCPVEVIPNGVDVGKYQVVSDKYKEETAKNNKIIITTSRLVKKNGLDDLIKALVLLSEEFKLKIVGTGPEEENLKKIVADLKLDERVEFMGFVENEKIPELLNQADIFARPSLSEGLGNSFLEAMASGLPTVGTPVGGIPDFLHDGKTGWLCEVNNSASIAEKIKFVTDQNNEEMVEKVKQQAKDLVAKNYDWDKIAIEMGRVFKQLIS